MFRVNSGHMGIIVHSTIIYCVSTTVLNTEATLVKRKHAIPAVVDVTVWLEGNN